MTFILPKPPSINHIYGFTSRGGFARSYITKEGKTWFEEAGYKINAQKQGMTTLTTPIKATIKLFTAFRRDIDNFLKPVLDVLQKQLVIENDTLIHELHVYKFKVGRDDERVEVELEKTASV